MRPGRVFYLFVGYENEGRGARKQSVIRVQRTPKHTNSLRIFLSHTNPTSDWLHRAEWLDGTEGATSYICEIELSEFTCRGDRLEFKVPLLLSPKLTQSGQFLTIQRDDLGIDVIANSRQQLLTKLQEQLCMLWIEFATEDDELLDGAAVVLKNRLLEMVKKGT